MSAERYAAVAATLWQIAHARYTLNDEGLPNDVLGFLTSLAVMFEAEGTASRAYETYTKRCESVDAVLDSLAGGGA